MKVLIVDYKGNVRKLLRSLLDGESGSSSRRPWDGDPADQIVCSVAASRLIVKHPLAFQCFYPYHSLNKVIIRHLFW